ncbi:hypothetical protein HPB47_026343 [Ixodes persulcatus]|uniref:Uncharacterized protein n=1 Tax=Ixodes persulcatus TaxID=34615 RepID=A0AC60Q1D3_IXOPE|nr:hypothetical protein HPB47_026343 [Ixodes persulcatus]
MRSVKFAALESHFLSLCWHCPTSARASRTVSDITEDLIDDYNKIEDAPDVDFLLRTSGERRLSDFLLLQSNYSLIHVERKYFPECTPRDVWRALLSFSENSSALLRVKEEHRNRKIRSRSHCDSNRVLRQQIFLSRVEKERLEYLLRLSQDDIPSSRDTPERMEKCGHI